MKRKSPVDVVEISDDDDDDDVYDPEDDCGYDDDDYEGEIDEKINLGAEEAEIYSVLSLEEIQKRQNADVCMICSICTVPREIAILLLIQFNWNVNVFSDEERIRKAIGLLSGQSVSSGMNNHYSILCSICFENFDLDQMRAAACGHLFCITCWDSYISIAIDEGPNCLTLRCPDPPCSTLIGEDLIKLVSIEYQKKYNHYLLRSYVENNKNLKWCPAPDCEHAVEFEVEPQTVNFDVKCNCSYCFCWSCLEEAHRPVDCDTVAKWNYKNSNESGNTEWILANSKPCPKCKKPIEKNHGCMHMTCAAPCKHEFCWLCLGPWKEHGSSSFYSCNKYVEARKDGQFSEEEKKRAAAKESLNRYTHFYERWAANESSRKQSVLHLEKLQSDKLQQISDAQKVAITTIDFIPKAWEQIIECRRVLKWAYAYGYYIPFEQKAKKQFFEFTQGEAEKALERLHQCAEEEVTKYENVDNGCSQNLSTFQEKLTRLTELARDYFDKLVRALENGLEEVESTNETNYSDYLEMDLDYWQCSRCTLYNSNEEFICRACTHPRQDLG